MSKADLAIAYCRALGLDPDELVFGYTQGVEQRFSKPRWMWMEGADPSLADGATSLSPKQRSLGYVERPRA